MQLAMWDRSTRLIAATGAMTASSTKSSSIAIGMTRERAAAKLTICSSAPDIIETMTDFPIELMRHYREEADRVRDLADQAVLPGIRDALLGVVRQYEDLAETLDDRRG